MSLFLWFNVLISLHQTYFINVIKCNIFRIYIYLNKTPVGQGPEGYLSANVSHLSVGGYIVKFLN